MNTHFQFSWTVNRMPHHTASVYLSLLRSSKRVFESTYTISKGRCESFGFFKNLSCVYYCQHSSWFILVGVQWYLLLLVPTNDGFFSSSLSRSLLHTFTTKSTSYSSPWGRWHFLPQSLSSSILGSPWGPACHGRGSTLACCSGICW